MPENNTSSIIERGTVLGKRGVHLKMHKDAPHVSRAPVAMATVISQGGGMCSCRNILLSRCENLPSAELSWVRAESSWTSV